jgi:hypothetical protein
MTVFYYKTRDDGRVLLESIVNKTVVIQHLKGNMNE